MWNHDKKLFSQECEETWYARPHYFLGLSHIEVTLYCEWEKQKKEKKIKSVPSYIPSQHLWKTFQNVLLK